MNELTLDELKIIEFNILKHFDAFCKEHNIRYYLAYGTLLGAIRYKKFIPYYKVLVLADLDVEMDAAIAEAIYVGTATDTGCFKFSNTTPLAHRIAADAIEAGLDFLPHNRTFFEAKSKVRFMIERKMFDDMIFSDNGEVCCSHLERAWLNEIGATDDDLDNLSTLTMQLEGVRCGIILTQNKKDKAYKVSVRSHRPADASRICQNFGGGGHPRAAGCTVDLPAEEACKALMAAAAEELAKW